MASSLGPQGQAGRSQKVDFDLALKQVRGSPEDVEMFLKGLDDDDVDMDAGGPGGDDLSAGSAACVPSPPPSQPSHAAPVPHENDQTGEHKCSKCGEVQRRSGFLIVSDLNPGLEWQGHLEGYCYECHSQLCEERTQTPLTRKQFRTRPTKIG